MESRGQGGAKLGRPNKTTLKAKEIILAALDGQAYRVHEALDEIYNEDGPKAFIDAFAKLAGHVLPKDHNITVGLNPDQPFSWMAKIENPYTQEPDVA